MMSEEAEEAYVKIMYNSVLLILKMKLMFEIILQTTMLLRKMGPRPEDEPTKTDAQIVDEVLKAKTTSRTSTFLAHLGVGSSSRKNAVSTASIRELEERLAE
jgi:hypothetical protein